MYDQIYLCIGFVEGHSVALRQLAAQYKTRQVVSEIVFSVRFLISAANFGAIRDLASDKAVGPLKI